MSVGLSVWVLSGVWAALKTNRNKEECNSSSFLRLTICTSNLKYSNSRSEANQLNIYIYMPFVFTHYVELVARKTNARLQNELHWVAQIVYQTRILVLSPQVLRLEPRAPQRLRSSKAFNWQVTGDISPRGNTPPLWQHQPLLLYCGSRTSS